MSRILPEPLVGEFSPEVVEVYRAFKAIPGDDITVWVGLPIHDSRNRPDFLVTLHNRYAFLVAVASESQSDFEESAGLSLFRAKGNALSPGMREAERMRKFFFAALSHLEDADKLRSVTWLVLFPRVSQTTLDQMPADLIPADVFLLGRESCSAKGLAAFIASETPPALEDEALLRLRSAFTPECLVPPRFSPRRVMSRNLDPQLTPLLLDYDQEQWAKNRLILSPEASLVANDKLLYAEASLVTGVAGSGKSLVLLFRACTQAKLAPGSSSLVLTHNRALKNELESRFGDLGHPPNVQWHTFYSWLHQILSAHRAFPEILQYSERDLWIAEAAWPNWGELSQARIDFLREEFDWMQDRDVVEEEQYLCVERAGRGIPLSEQARRKVFASYQAYRQRLTSEGREDWSGVALLAWRLVQSGTIPLPSYDFVYIDEAQFFAPVWFRIVRAALTPKTGRIFMAADPTQGFLKRKQAWSHCGLDMRGRATRLRRSYRSTSQILRFAADFYRQRLQDEDLPYLNLPGEDELALAPAGSPPSIIPLSARQDEITRVCNEITDCLREGVTPGAILVIVAGENRLTQTLDILRTELGEHLVKNAREDSANDYVRVCGINAATGLEAPLVFVLGTAELIDAERNYQLREEAKAELIRDNTRRLYMAFTRAAQHLVITWTASSLPDWLMCSSQIHEGRNDGFPA